MILKRYNKQTQIYPCEILLFLCIQSAFIFFVVVMYELTKYQDHKN